MFINLILLALIGLSSQANPRCRPSPARHPIWEDASTLVGALSTTIQAEIRVAVLELNALQEALAGTARQALRDSATQIQTVADKMAAEVAHIRTGMTDSNAQRVEHCIALYTYEMGRIPEYFTEQVEQCADNLVIDGNSRIQKTIAAVSGVEDIAASFRSGITACQREANSDECISVLVIQVLIETLDAPGSVRASTAQTVQVGAQFKEALAWCYISRMQPATTMADLVLRYIRSCAGVN